MTRLEFIERHLRQIYGGFPTDDAQITNNLVNSWLNDAIAAAAKQNQKDNIALDGISYINNSFYTTYKGLAVVQDENFLFKVTLPQIPMGVGYSEGVSTLQFKDSSNSVSHPCVPLSQNQKTFYQGLKPIPNKVLFYTEGNFIYAISTLPLYDYTATVGMISGGDSTSLTSTLNVPPDYFPIMVEYLKQQLVFERMQPQDSTNDGVDNKG
jgi:hypothetical protein